MTTIKNRRETYLPHRPIDPEDRRTLIGLLVLTGVLLLAAAAVLIGMVTAQAAPGHVHSSGGSFDATDHAGLWRPVTPCHAPQLCTVGGK